MRRIGRGLLTALACVGLVVAPTACDDDAGTGGGGTVSNGGGGEGGGLGGGGAGGATSNGAGGAGGTAGGGGGAAVPDRPAFEHPERGTCAALVQPAALEDEAEILEAVKLIGEFSPRRLAPVHVWNAVHDAAEGLTLESTGCEAFGIYHPGHFEVSAPEQGCGADGHWWWGSMSARRTAQGGFVPTGYRYEVEASSFIQQTPELLLEFDGHSKLECNDPYSSMLCLDTKYGIYGSGSGLLRLVREDPVEPGELPTGAWFLSWNRTGSYWDDEPDLTRGYLLHAEGELGPQGDLCFTQSSGTGFPSTLELRGARTVNLEWSAENGWTVVEP